MRLRLKFSLLNSQKFVLNLLFGRQFVKIKLKHYFWRKNTKIMIKLTSFNRRQSPPYPTSLAEFLYTTKSVGALKAEFLCATKNAVTLKAEFLCATKNAVTLKVEFLRTAQNAGHLEVRL